MARKTSKQETTTAVIVNEKEFSVSLEENHMFTNLSSKLAEIGKMKGVIGYIIRNENSATIDLKKPEKLVEYAIFSSQVLDSTRQISNLFELGDVKSIILEGKKDNALCMNIEGNKIGIFLEKDAEKSGILKKVLP